MILLDTTCALAHIGVYILHIMLSAYQVFGAVAGEKFSVVLTTRQLDNTLEFSFIFIYLFIFIFYFYFTFTSAGNLVFVFRV